MIARLLPALPVSSAAKVFIAFIITATCTHWATPRLSAISNEPKLEETVPRQFGDWRELTNPYPQVSLATGPEAELNQPYDQTVMRTYVNSQGQQIMLALAWGRHQRQEVKVHRPELCYVAQGFKVSSLTTATFRGIAGYGEIIKGKHMIVRASRDGEAVAYWIRIGTLYSENAIETRTHIFKEGLAGRIPDGILVRASQKIQLDTDAEKAFPLLEAFLAELVAATPENARLLMVRG